MLTDEYGVDFSGVEWVQGSINSAGRHGNPTVPPLLKKVNIKVNNSGKSLSDLIDARRDRRDHRHGLSGTPCAQTRRSDDCSPTFPEVERDYYTSTGIYPIMHW